MRGLSLTQPWATLVAIGKKRVETRSWGTDYRGRIAIHAAKKFPVEAKYIVTEQPFAAALGWNLIGNVYLPLGMILATADVLDCRRTETVIQPTLPTLLRSARSWSVEPGSDEYQFGDYTPGRWAWLLGNVVQLTKPVPCKGALQLWKVPDPIIAAINDALPQRGETRAEFERDRLGG